MKKSEIEQLARKIKEELKKRRIKSYATLVDLRLLVKCKEEINFLPMQETKLYRLHGGEYCEALGVLYALTH